MKSVLFIFVLFSFYTSYSQDANKVLIFIKEESSQLEFMLKNEVVKMSEMLEESGFEVTTATVSGKELNIGSVALTPDLRLKQVNIDDYDGFIIPCMVVDTTTQQTINFVQSIAEKDKPIAAQVASVYLLAKAGVLEGKKYALYSDQSNRSEFEGSIYNGNGLVQDGKVITSGGCPWSAHRGRAKDMTAELTQSLMDVINSEQ